MHGLSRLSIAGVWAASLTIFCFLTIHSYTVRLVTPRGDSHYLRFLPPVFHFSVPTNLAKKCSTKRRLSIGSDSVHKAMTSRSTPSRLETPQTPIGRARQALQYPILWKPYLCKKHPIDPVHLNYLFFQPSRKEDGSPRTANSQKWSRHRCSVCRMLPFQVVDTESHSHTTEASSFSIVDLYEALGMYRGTRYVSKQYNNMLRSSLGYKNAECALQIDTRAGVFVPGRTGHSQNENGSAIAQVIDPSCIEFSNVRNWIEHCHENHKVFCRTKTGSHAAEFLKTLSVIDCNSCCIVILPNGQDYLALSYVWGPPIKPGLLTESFTDLDFTKCPRTIKDSIQVTRSLGYRYLWVDRYCIDQSNALQKSYQLAMMDHIYENAAMTLVAAAGLDDRHGLPGAGTLPLVPRVQQTLLRINDVSLVHIGSRIDDALQSTKWAERGWTYQEMFLSAKCLFFTEKQVVLTCRASVYYEDLVYDDNFPLVEPLLQPNKSLSVKELETHIARYMMRSLTYQHDSLNAFKGILSRCSFHSYWGIPLITSPKGLSDETASVSTNAFLLGLGWHISSHTEKYNGVGQSPRRNSMPSWSWVSLTLKHSRIKLLGDPWPLFPLFQGYRHISENIYGYNRPLQIRALDVCVWLPSSRGIHRSDEAWRAFEGMETIQHRKVIEEFAPLLKINTSFWEVRSVTPFSDNTLRIHLSVQDIDNRFIAHLDTKMNLDELKDATREHNENTKEDKVTHLRWRVLMISQWAYNSEDEELPGWLSRWNTVFLVVRPSGTYWERVGFCDTTMDMDAEIARAKKDDFVLC